MNPFFFTSSNSRLYAAYHAPATMSYRDMAVLLCPPIAQEYMRSHWSFRRLSDLLAADGYHVLRFDYFGSGDSAGEFSDGNAMLWQRDIQAAANELQDLSGSRRLGIIGLRFGATLAAATEGLATDTLVLWDPVITGSNYLDSLKLMHNSYLAKINLSRKQKVVSTNYELLGFPFPEEMQASILKLDLVSGIKNHANNIFLLASHKNEQIELLLERFANLPSKFSYKVIQDAGDWDQVDALTDAFLPSAILQEIVDILRRS